jgi:UDP-glucose 4-epimerase
LKTKKNILVTGASGLIGFSLIEKLSENNVVYAISRNILKIKNDNIKNIIHDFSKSISTDKFPESIDIIYHLAQSEHFRNFPKKVIDIFNVNTISTLKLLEYARKSNCKKFIYASSGGVYGNSQYGFNEDTILRQNPNIGFYLTSKFCSELILDNYTCFFDVVISRFFFVYGERQNKSMLIPRLIGNIKKELPVVLNGKNGIMINPIYVLDAVDCLMAMNELEGNHKINVGGKEILSLRKISNIIGDLIGVKPVFEISDDEPLNLIGNIEKMNLLLNEPKFSFRNGVKILLNEKK